MSVRRPLRPSHQRGMAVVLAVGWLLALMLMIQAWALAEVLDDDRDSLRRFHQLQAFEAARSGLDWGLFQAGRTASPCPVPKSTLKTLKAAPSATAVPDTAWMSCSWPQTTSASPEPTAQDPRCVCAANGTPPSSNALPGLDPPGFTLEFSRPAGSPWLLLQAKGCAADCDALLGHTAKASVQWRWQSAWLASAAWPVALLAGGRISAEGLTPLNIDAPGAWALVAGHDALPQGASSNAPSVTGGRWDIAQGPHPLASPALPADLATWAAAPSTSSASSDPVAAPRLSALWVAARWPAPAAASEADRPTDPLIRISGDWTVPAGTRLGSVQDPVLLRVDGTLRVNAPGVSITGLVLADATDISAGLTLNGALWVGGDVTLSGDQPISLRHDPALVQSAWLLAGRFVARRGSWRDF